MSEYWQFYSLFNKIVFLNKCKIQKKYYFVWVTFTFVFFFVLLSWLTLARAVEYFLGFFCENNFVLYKSSLFQHMNIRKFSNSNGKNSILLWGFISLNLTVFIVKLEIFLDFVSFSSKYLFKGLNDTSTQPKNLPFIR